MAEAGNCPTIFETWFTEPQKLIAGEFIADITDNLKARGWDKAMNPLYVSYFPKMAEFTVHHAMAMHLELCLTLNSLKKQDL